MRRRLALASVVLLGAALRFYPIWFGLPYAQARPDETASLGYALKILDGDPNPHFFHWPSLTFYVFAGLLATARAVIPLGDFSGYALVARASIAVAGTLTIVLVTRLTRRLADDSTAVIAALLLAVAVLHVRESHFALTDVLMTLFATGCLTLLVEAADAPHWRTLALAGLAGGLATSTKYSAAALLAAGLAVPGAGSRGLLAFLGAFVFGFVAGTPYALIDFGTFHADVSFVGGHLAAGHGVADLGRGWSYHLARSLPYGLGFPTFVAAIAGIGLLAAGRRRAALPLAVFALLFFLAIGSGRTVFFRYILPLVPLACVAAAIAVGAIAKWLVPRLRLPESIATALLGVSVAAMPLMDSVRMDVRLARADSRVRAAEWLAPQLRPAHTLHDAGGDYTKLDLGRAAFHEWRYDPATRSFGDPAGRTPDWIVLYESPLTEYAGVPAALRELVAARYSLVHRERAMALDSNAVFDRQDAFFLPIRGFAGVERPGPDVLIYFRR